MLYTYTILVLTTIIVCGSLLLAGQALGRKRMAKYQTQRVMDAWKSVHELLRNQQAVEWAPEWEAPVRTAYRETAELVKRVKAL